MFLLFGANSLLETGYYQHRLVCSYDSKKETEDGFGHEHAAVAAAPEVSHYSHPQTVRTKQYTSTQNGSRLI